MSIWTWLSFHVVGRRRRPGSEIVRGAWEMTICDKTSGTNKDKTGVFQ